MACSGAAMLFAQSARTVWDGVYTDAQAARGAAAYTKECAFCHMDDLSGGEFAPPLMADPFTRRWQDGVVGDLLTIIKKTMPADGPGRLTAQEYADIVAYLLSMNKWPAGPKELSTDPAALKVIVFKKPE